MPFMGLENSHSLYCVLTGERRDSEVQSHLLGLCWPHLFGSWDGSELGSALAALKGASAEQMGCLWSGRAYILDPAFLGAYSKGLETG